MLKSLVGALLLLDKLDLRVVLLLLVEKQFLRFRKRLLHSFFIFEQKVHVFLVDLELLPDIRLFLDFLLQLEFHGLEHLLLLFVARALLIGDLLLELGDLLVQVLVLDGQILSRVLHLFLNELVQAANHVAHFFYLSLVVLDLLVHVYLILDH